MVYMGILGIKWSRKYISWTFNNIILKSVIIIIWWF